MSTLLERHIESIHRRLIVLAPPEVIVPSFFNNVSPDVLRHGQLINRMQKLRGSVYLTDGALRPHELSEDGLHQTAEDDRSWHLLMLDKDEDVSACIWYLEHHDAVTVDELRVRSSALANLAGSSLREAVEAELARAKRERVVYSEVGGWAVSGTHRRKTDGLLLILATFGLSRILGGALGVSTATVRHSSAAMLRRLGLSCLEAEGNALPAYYDQQYDCEMEVLRFDTRRSSPRYHGLIEQLKHGLAKVAVVGGRTEPNEVRLLTAGILPRLQGLLPGDSTGSPLIPAV